MGQSRRTLNGPIRLPDEFHGAADSYTRDSQLAGIAVLISLSISQGLPATSYDLFDGSRELSANFSPASPGVTKRGGPAGVGRPSKSLLQKLRSDHLIRNSLYLILSSGLQAGFGFAFWVVTARLFSTTEVGIASSLVSAITVISFISILGLNSTFVRFLPTARNPNALITVGLLLVFACGAIVSLGYVAAIPIIAPRLSFIDHRLDLAIGFVLLSAFAGINLLTDSIYIASRKSSYNAVIDGVIGGAGKVIAVFALAGTGAYGLFCASASGYVIAGVASLILMVTHLRWRATTQGSFEAIKPLLRFTLANYAANGFGLLPIFIVPLIVLDRLGAPAEAYYFIAFQMATLLYSAGFAVEQNFLAEASQAGANFEVLQRRGRRITILMCLPPCILLTVSAHWVLLIFGHQYSQNATLSLMALSVGAVPTAANNWFVAILRLKGNLHRIIWSSVVYAVSICGLAWFLAPHGLGAVSAAWPIGCTLGAIVAGLPRNQDSRRHRRIVRSV